MHDIKFIRANPDAFDAGLKRRGLPAQAKEILEWDAQSRSGKNQEQELRARQNQITDSIKDAVSKGEKPPAALLEESKLLKQQLADLKEPGFANALENIGNLIVESAIKSLHEKLTSLPNQLADDVPEGADEKGNVEIRKWTPTPTLPLAGGGSEWKPKEHFELGEALGLMDFEGAAKLSGARFVVLKGALARMERALASFFLDHNVNAGYTEMAPPFLVRDNAAFGTGQLPKFAEDLFRTTNDFWLIPTAEVPLTNLVADSILDEEKLPMRMTAYTPCFRSEAGSAGKDTRGMIRQHQFSKVEMVSITAPEASQAEHERMVGNAEAILQKLGLPYRTMLLCTGDSGFSAEKTYDIEVWLPGQGAYREISSCSNCGAFQARRMKARLRRKGAKETEFVHTLNGSGLPIGRTMVAILENYQQEDGSIRVPDALVPYMGGLTRVEGRG